MSCKYCSRADNDFVLLNKKTVQCSGIGVGINRQGMLRVGYYDEASYVYMEDIVNISFCPMCGRKLEED